MKLKRRILLSLSLAALFFIIIASATLYLTLRPQSRLPSFSQVKKTYTPSNAVLYDRNREAIHELRVHFHGRRGQWTPLKDISPALIQAVTLSEDKRFALHRGVDWKAIAGATVKYLLFGNRRGASTITMQVVSLVNPKKTKKTLIQKIEQIKAARELEKRWTKEEIMEAYLNLVTFRGEVQGIDAASKALFDKVPSGLDIGEALLLCALIPSPNAKAEAVLARARRIDAALSLGVGLDRLKESVKASLLDQHDRGPQLALAPHVAYQLLKKNSSLPVQTTLDRGLQSFAIEALRRNLAALEWRNVKDGAVLVVNNATGEVLAYVGNTWEGSSARYVDGVRAKRQAGSTLKPFLYALTLDRKILTAASPLLDAPVYIATLRGIYEPSNYDKDYKGMVPVREALASSLNTPAVRTLSLVGPEAFVEKLGELGIKGLRDGNHYGLSLALGTADASLWELVNAYKTLARGGLTGGMSLLPPATEASTKPQQVFSRGASFIIADILSDREARSATFSLENVLATRFWSAVKTGTSKDMRDNWCIGFSSRYTVGVWVGNFSGQSMYNVSGMSGAAPVWFEVMSYLEGNASASSPPAPVEEVVSVPVLFTDKGVRKMEWFLTGTQSTTITISKNSSTPQILYPPQDTVIAVDPDIPADLQKVFFEAETKGAAVSWRLNGSSAGKTRILPWSPVKGTHKLELVDVNNQVVDTITFYVKN